MNANELADELDKCMEDGSTDLVCVEKAATMLRQQQAEIEALKQIIDANNLSQNIGQFVKPAKTLTDEEIWKLWQKHLNDEIPVFARAILRKAQEK